MCVSIMSKNCVYLNFKIPYCYKMLSFNPVEKTVPMDLLKTELSQNFNL